MVRLQVIRFALVLLFAFGCGGDPKLGGPCAATCDCKATNAGSKCVGEWVCNSASTCEYTCKTACSGAVSTCGADEDCNGSFCSSRKGC
jgi:hypothetical protein